MDTYKGWHFLPTNLSFKEIRENEEKKGNKI